LLKGKNENGELKNIYIKKNNYGKGFQITFAKKGVFETKGNKKVLVLYDGQTLNQNNNKVTNFDFSKSDYGTRKYGLTSCNSQKDTRAINNFFNKMCKIYF
jgi:lipopolysaccharide export system permease protein